MALADPEKSQTLCIKAANRVEACTRSISWHCRLDRVAKRADDLRLPVSGDVAVARKRRQHILVAEVLGPRLVLLGRLADLAAEKRQGLPEAVRVEVGEAGGREGALENRSDRAGAAPVLAVEARCLEMPTVPNHDLRRRE